MLIFRVESVDVDEVSVRVPEFLSHRLDDHSLASPVVSQENYALISRDTVNQLLLFLSPEKNAVINILSRKEHKTLPCYQEIFPRALFLISWKATESGSEEES